MNISKIADLLPSAKFLSDEPKKLYVGRLPKGATDDYIERLLRVCGDLKSWKRSRDASGEPRAFGFAEFDSLEAVFTVLKLVNNAAITVDSTTSRILVKSDEKTTAFLQGWVDIKRHEWTSRLEKLGVAVDLADYEEKEALGETMPWEKDIIPQYEKVRARVDRLLENPREVIVEDDGNILESSHINMTSASAAEVHATPYEDPFLRYKEHEREQRRERRIRNQERDREARCEKRVEEWLQREVNRDREQQREAERERDRGKERGKLIEADVGYDSGEERRARKKNPKEAARVAEERKRLREKEREDDEMDR